jgi:hypothetical protein
VIYLSGAVKPKYATWIPGSSRHVGEWSHARRHLAYDNWSDWGSGIGFMHQPGMGNRPQAGVWAADNGCFTNPDAFDVGRYRRWLDARDRYTCLFVTAPDWVGEWCSTLDRYYEVAETLRADGWKVALVAQDGLQLYLDVIDWSGIDALFLGGSTEWKLSADAADLVRDARSAGLWCHMGRCNSRRRLRVAHDMGCDSADGTFLAHAGGQGLAEVRGWLETLVIQTDLLSLA